VLTVFVDVRLLDEVRGLAEATLGQADPEKTRFCLVSVFDQEL